MTTVNLVMLTTIECSAMGFCLSVRQYIHADRALNASDPVGMERMALFPLC